MGSAREVISRTLAPLTTEGSLHIDTSGVTITNCHQLRDHANVD